MTSKKLSERKGLQGIVKRHPDGFGFFIPDDVDYPDVYIPKKHMVGVMSHDRIEIDTFFDRDGVRFRGEVTKILDRKIKKVVGRAHLLSPIRAILRDESQAWGENLRVDILGGVKVNNGDWISVEVTTYPQKEPGSFCGRLVEVLGDHLNPLIDLKRVLYEKGIPMEFPKAVEEEAKSYSTEVDEKEKGKRKDLTRLNFITIDGATAKDFDDAIYVARVNQGFNLIVAIADVSHYVKTNTQLDKEAYKRGNSTYFPNYVVPMLPEVLSNELCSLKPHVDRLAMVADLFINFEGEVFQSSFYEAVIQSRSRVTYGEAQEIIDGNDIEKHSHVKENILLACDLAKILLKKRNKQGTLTLEIPETEIELDESGEIIDIIRSERLFSHQLIEEMMLIANISVAEFLVSRSIETLFRIHEEPQEEPYTILQNYLGQCGYLKSIQGDEKQKKLSKALSHFKGEKQELVLHILTLRSMSQAQYSPTNVGHFGLGFKNYSHFTSPIRRYPDLIVHRCLKSVVHKERYKKRISREDLLQSGTHCSATEQRSVKAERLYKSIKKAKFMQKRIGESFDGVISSVAKFGVFVLLRKYDVDGLVKLEELPGYGLEFDETSLTISSSRTGVTYAIGDTMRVTVASVDIDQGKIDFLVEGEEKGSSSLGAKKAKKKSQNKKSLHDLVKDKMRKKKYKKKNSQSKKSSKKKNTGLKKKKKTSQKKKRK